MLKNPPGKKEEPFAAPKKTERGMTFISEKRDPAGKGVKDHAKRKEEVPPLFSERSLNNHKTGEVLPTSYCEGKESLPQCLPGKKSQQRKVKPVHQGDVLSNQR